MTSASTDINSKSSTSIINNKNDNIDSFKEVEETLMTEISVLDGQQFDDLLSWFTTVEEVFKKLKYHERMYVSFAYDYLVTSLQEWHDQNYCHFKNNWSDFKQHLSSLLNQTSLPMPSAVTTTTQSVTFSSAIVNKQEQEQNQQSQSEQQRAEETQRVISTVPNFDGTDAEGWFSNLLRKFRELDLEPETMLYYTKYKFSGQSLIWYYENFSKFDNFSTFVKLFRLQFIEISSSNPFISSSTKVGDRKPSSSSTTTSLPTFSADSFAIRSPTDTVENILQKIVIEDIIKNPKTFTGKENISTWIEQVEHLFITSKWPEDLRLQYIPQFLKNDAKHGIKIINQLECRGMNLKHKSRRPIPQLMKSQLLFNV
ncbi:unnamed protein product [Didymodactylos carnosus]|uniref:Uncharacterized protein n=1 Tax=Didymodactylos carnosus TaxID=1234261 RepID=A0A816BXG1_9BILA|nr:unnamed protein product [Didymodactylos carnosus]CAF4500118.1 unnamed protein product [Didymodactylos carnosus]